MIAAFKDGKRCRQFSLCRPGGQATLETLVIIVMAAVAALSLYTVLRQLTGAQPSRLDQTFEYQRRAGGHPVTGTTSVSNPRPELISAPPRQPRRQ